jgi:pimeloyl-ACP methyl ester carboxylesterase
MPEASNDGVMIHYEVTGTGTPVVLLHGFPDTGACWRHQVAALVDAGYQAIVPDLRGYGRSAKPEGVDAYNIIFLAGDVAAVLDDAGVERAHVVGHDWGAGVAWAFAMFAPERVDRLCVLSVGYPATFRRTHEQREKSWYMLLFEHQGIAEQWLRDDDWLNLREWGSHPEIDAVSAELERSDALTPGLNYYRANVPAASWVGAPMALPKVTAPTMGVWSTGDFALTEIQMTDSASGVDGEFRYECVEGAGHWLQLDAPDRVSELLVDFFGA